jgi:hypothetical protein
MWLAPCSSRRSCYATEQGYAIAQSNLGAMYYSGYGVLQDPVLAHMWFNISGSIGFDLGSENRGIIEKRMTRDPAKVVVLTLRCHIQAPVETHRVALYRSNHSGTMRSSV